MRIVTVALLCTLVGASIGCSSFPVDADYDPAFDYARLKTWGWGPFDESIQNQDPRLNNELLHRRIQGAITTELEARGYRYTNEAPDFWVEYHLSVDRKIDVQNLRTSVGYGWGYGGMVVSEPVVREYEEGTMLLDFLDPGQQRLFWRGSVSVRLRGNETPQQRDDRTRAFVKAVVDQFPPGHEK